LECRMRFVQVPRAPRCSMSSRHHSRRAHPFGSP
jgi:hypothetical protein